MICETQHVLFCLSDILTACDSMAPETRKLVVEIGGKMNCTWERLIFWSYVLYGDDFEKFGNDELSTLCPGTGGTDGVINYHANICRELEARPRR